MRNKIARIAALAIIIFCGALPAQAVVAQTTSPNEANVITLEEALELAVRNNPNLLNADEQLLQAQIGVNQSWALVLPNLSLSYSYTDNEDEVIFAMPGMDEVAIVPDTQETTSFQANMALVNVSSWATIKKAYKGREMTDHAVRQARNDLLLGVASAYYQVSSQEELIEAARLNLNNAKELKRLTDASSKLGLNTKVDVLRAEQNLINAQKEYEDAKDALKISKISLAKLMGSQGDFEIERPNKPEAVSAEDADLAQIALNSRADYKAQMETVRMAEIDRKITASKFLPTMDVTYIASQSEESGLSGDEAHQVVIGAQWSILQGGSRIAQMSADKSAIRVEQNDLRALELDIREEVEQALVDVKKRERNIELAAKQVELAEESYVSVTRQYEVGLASSLDLSDALTALGGARTGLVVEELMYDLAVLNLRRAIGIIYAM